MTSSLVGKIGLGALLLTGALTGCSDGTGPDAQSQGMEATWAGQRWSGDAYATLVQGDTLYLGAATPRNAGSVAQGSMRTRVVFHGPDTYPLGAGDAVLEYLVGGDALTGSYVSSRANAGTLQVTEYGNGWIAGRVSFEATSTYGSAPVGQSAHFQGSFRAQVRSWP